MWRLAPEFSRMKEAVYDKDGMNNIFWIPVSFIINARVFHNLLSD